MGKRKIRMLTSGPNKNYRPGEVVEVDHVRAKLLVDRGDAEYPKQGRPKSER